MLHWDNGRIMFKDKFLEVYPIEITSKKSKKSCFSYLCVPVQGPGRFDIDKAKGIEGLEPFHYGQLQSGFNI